MNETLTKLLKSYSTYVVAAITGAAAYWLQLSAAEQQTLLTTYPILTKLAPLAGFIAFLVARAAPQPSVTGEKPEDLGKG